MIVDGFNEKIGQLQEKSTVLEPFRSSSQDLRQK